LGPTLLLGLNPSITLAFFTQIKRVLLRAKQVKELGAGLTFVAGLLAKWIACVLARF
jgi:uncharacterized membrane protein YphA (DoxX/SURF4 family)